MADEEETSEIAKETPTLEAETVNQNTTESGVPSTELDGAERDQALANTAEATLGDESAEEGVSVEKTKVLEIVKSDNAERERKDAATESNPFDDIRRNTAWKSYDLAIQTLTGSRSVDVALSDIDSRIANNAKTLEQYPNDRLVKSSNVHLQNARKIILDARGK